MAKLKPISRLKGDIKTNDLVRLISKNNVDFVGFCIKEPDKNSGLNGEYSGLSIETIRSPNAVLEGYTLKFNRNDVFRSHGMDVIKYEVLRRAKK